MRSAQHEDVERDLFEWIEIISKKIPISGPLIQEKGIYRNEEYFIY